MRAFRNKGKAKEKNNCKVNNSSVREESPSSSSEDIHNNLEHIFELVCKTKTPLHHHHTQGRGWWQHTDHSNVDLGQSESEIDD